MSEWISVKKEMPKEFIRVLAYAEKNDDFPFLDSNYFESSFDGEDWHEEIDYCRIFVTHWMPLPKPPISE